MNQQQEYLFDRLNAVERELEEFESFSTCAEILIAFCNEQIEAELFDPAENLLVELENLVVVFSHAKTDLLFSNIQKTVFLGCRIK